jgi:hypothetical protein
MLTYAGVFRDLFINQMNLLDRYPIYLLYQYKSTNSVAQGLMHE